MDHFQDIFQQAVIIKNSQMLSRRQKFEAQPLFIKAGLYYLNKFSNVRTQSFIQRYIVSEYLKQSGNTFYKSNDLDKAAHEYEQSLSIFRYITNKNKNWKNEGIIDDDLEYIEETGFNYEQNQKLKTMKVTIYINLSLTYLKLKKYASAIKASEEALILDPNNTKALYRRAKARSSDINAGLNEFTAALKDLEMANSIDPDDKIIKEEIAKISIEIKNLKHLEKKNTFSGIFNKPIYKTTNEDISINKPAKQDIPLHKPPAKQELPLNKPILKEDLSVRPKETPMDAISKSIDKLSYKLSYEIDPNAKIPNEINELGNFLNYKGPQIVKLYEATGKLKEAEDLKEKLKTALAAKDQLEKIASLDFNKPTPHLKEMAEKLNIDLFDPSIKNELIKVQAQNIGDLRKWLDEVNKNPEDKEKNRKQVKNAEISTTTQTTQIGNNYYINNNFYSNHEEKPKEKQEICKQCEKKQQNNKEANTFGSLMNYFIIILAFVLILLTLVLHFFSE